MELRANIVTVYLSSSRNFTSIKLYLFIHRNLRSKPKGKSVKES